MTKPWFCRIDWLDLTFIIVTKTNITYSRDFYSNLDVGVCVNDDWLDHTRHRNRPFGKIELKRILDLYNETHYRVPSTQAKIFILSHCTIVTKNQISLMGEIFIWIRIWIHSFRKVLGSTKELNSQLHTDYKYHKYTAKSLVYIGLCPTRLSHFVVTKQNLALSHLFSFELDLDSFFQKGSWILI